MSSLKTKKNRAERRKLLFRIGAIILAALMVGGTLYSAFAFFFMNVYARYDEYAFSTESSGVPYITVGIVYGSDSPTAYPIRSASGFVVGSVYADNTTRSFTPFFTLPQTTLTPAIDTNVALGTDGSYSPTTEYYQTKIGAYHIQLSANVTFDEMLNLVPQIDAAVRAWGLYAFPAYINGVLYIRVGDFAAYEQTVNTLSRIQHLFAGYGVQIVEPSDTAVSLIDPAAHHVVFEYDCGSNLYMGITPIQNGGEPDYLETPAKNLYEGVFAAKRYRTDTVNGITVFNVVDLEGCVEGILPYEVNNTWPTEALRANAIAIRSYALANRGAHYKDYGFDLCTSHCMSYRGRNKVSQAIIDVVSSTEGEVLSLNGKVVSAFFSSSNGGEAISPNVAWGGTKDVDMVGNAKTPWERYAEYSNGWWTKEYTPTELANRLRGLGHTELVGDIASVTIDEFAGQSSVYAKKVTVTDTYGNSVNFNTAGRIQNKLGLNSSNFRVARGTLYYSIEEVQSITVTNPVGMPQSSVKAEGNYSPYDYFTDEAFSLSGASLFTGGGIVEAPATQSFSVMTATGVYDISGSAHYFVGNQSVASGTASTTISPVDPETGLITAVSIHNGTQIVTVLKPRIEVVSASSPNNFIFAGKGWGHGVGLSQYGTYDLAKAGARAETILELYFSGAKIVHRSTVGW